MIAQAAEIIISIQSPSPIVNRLTNFFRPLVNCTCIALLVSITSCQIIANMSASISSELRKKSKNVLKYS